MAGIDKTQTSSITSGRLPWWGRCIRSILVPSFYSVSRLGFKVNVSGMENFTNQPGTILVANHKSDFDTIVLVPELYYAKCGKGPVRQLRFVAAEQMFEPGYVSVYLLKNHWQWVRKLLYPANMSALLKGGGAHPIPGSRTRKLGRQLRMIKDIFGNLPVDKVLASKPESVLSGCNSAAPISSILRWRYHKQLDKPCSVSEFNTEIASALRQAHIDEVEYSLDYFSKQLGSGKTVYIAPEGGLSREGDFKGIKAGLGRLVYSADTKVTLAPINFTYDWMTTGRKKVFMNVGAQLYDAQKLDRREMEGKIAGRIACLATITLPQLVAKIGEDKLIEGEYKTQNNILCDKVFYLAKSLNEDGKKVDATLLTKRGATKSLAKFLRYCKKKNLARRDGEKIIFSSDKKEPGFAQSWWRYSMNEFNNV